MITTREPHDWRKSSYSSSQTNCVEVGRVADDVAVRDTKDRDAGHFTARGPQWSSFLSALKRGAFDG